MRRLLVNLLIALNATQFADVTLLDKSCDSTLSKINLMNFYNWQKNQVNLINIWQMSWQSHNLHHDQTKHPKAASK